MSRDYPEPYRGRLRDLYVTLDRLSESVTGADARAVERVMDAAERALQAADEEREAEIDAEANRLVEAMIEAVQEAEP